MAKKEKVQNYQPNGINSVDIELWHCNFSEIDKLKGEKVKIILEGMLLNSAKFYHDGKYMGARLQFLGDNR